MRDGGAVVIEIASYEAPDTCTADSGLIQTEKAGGRLATYVTLCPFVT